MAKAVGEVFGSGVGSFRSRPGARGGRIGLPSFVYIVVGVSIEGEVGEVDDGLRVLLPLPPAPLAPAIISKPFPPLLPEAEALLSKRELNVPPPLRPSVVMPPVEERSENGTDSLEPLGLSAGLAEDDEEARPSPYPMVLRNPVEVAEDEPLAFLPAICP